MVSFRTQINCGGPCSNRLDRHGRFHSCCFVIYIYIYKKKEFPALLAHKDRLNAVVNTCVVLVVLLLCMCC